MMKEEKWVMEKHAFHFFFVSFLKFSFSISFFFISGLLRMQGMILQQMPITAQFRVFQEGIVLLPARASEQGNVIGLVSVYMSSNFFCNWAN